MIAKMFEIRDAGTLIPMLAVKLEPSCEADRWLLERAGYGKDPLQQYEYVVLCDINDGRGEVTCDPADWPGRTKRIAHEYIEKDFDELASGAVVDVQFICGDTASAKKSEATADATI